MIPPGSLPGWRGDELDDLAKALQRQCAPTRAPAGWPAPLCTEGLAAAGSPEALRRWIETRFEARPLIGVDGRREGLITGYHEPLLTGSLRRESSGQTPVYRRPPDLLAEGPQRFRRTTDGNREGRAPYPSRARIENESLLSGHELLWLDDPVEAFFLHVQGAGRVRLRDGSVQRIGFADHNGHAYRAIGAELVARGALRREDVDAPRIKRWLREHPQGARELMQSNPRFVFFRPLPPADGGPPGALGVPLTPLRSLATDPAFVPAGSLLWLDTSWPHDGQPLQRAMFSQDRGAAITGGVRADVYFGGDDRATRMAGTMKSPGRLWLLVPRSDAPAR